MQVGLDIDGSVTDAKVSVIPGTVKPEVVTIPSAGATDYYVYYTAQVSLNSGDKVTPKLLFSDVVVSKSLGPIVIRYDSKESITATYFSGKFLG